MRPRHAVLLTRSISTRLPQLLSYKQIALERPQISFFVSKRLRTLSFSVSCKSCVCLSCENWRMCTNNSRFGSHLAVIPEKIGLFFSCTYVEPILQPFCFQIHACHGGGVPPSGSPSLERDPRVPKSHPLSPFFSSSCALFCAFLHSSRIQPFSFHAFRHSLRKTGGCGVLWLTRHPMKDVCPERPSGVEGPLLRLMRESVLPAPDLIGEHPGEEHRDGGISLPRATEHGSRFSVASYLVASLLHYLQPATSLRSIPSRADETDVPAAAKTGDISASAKERKDWTTTGSNCVPLASLSRRTASSYGSPLR